MSTQTAPPEIAELAHRIRGALGAMDVPVELEMNEAGALLLATHPQLNATVAVELKRANDGPQVTLLLMLCDWQTVAVEPPEIERLLSMNTRMMTCAVTIIDIDDQRVLALARTLAATELEPHQVAEHLEQMAWEYSLQSELGRTTAAKT